MTAHQSHHAPRTSGLDKLARKARENLHWFAIVLWAVTIMAALAPLL